MEYLLVLNNFFWVWSQTLGLILAAKAISFAALLIFSKKAAIEAISEDPDPAPRYAGFERRAAACLIDTLIFLPPCFLLVFAVFFATALVRDPLQLFLINLAASFFLALAPALIAALFESSSLRASPGKLIFRIKVSDYAGRRLSFIRALERNLAFCLSELLFMSGFFYCIFSARKQCLHDLASKCLLKLV